jgi:hypothetical protein
MSNPELSAAQGRKERRLTIPLGSHAAHVPQAPQAQGPLAALINFLVQTPEDLRETNSYE